MTIRRFVRCEAKGKLVSYIHGGSKVGVLVDLVGGDDQLGKDLAMHIAASKPKSLDASGVSAELLDTERRLPLKRLAKLASRKPCWIRSLKVPFRNI
jgi:elongation factor Ts